MTGTPKPPAAPTGLSDRAKRLWKAVLTVYELAAAELELLRIACEQLDRGDQAAKIVKAEGVTVNDRYGTPKQHPAVDVEARSRSLFARLVAQLGVKLPDEASDTPTSRRARQAAAARWSNEARRRAS